GHGRGIAGAGNRRLDPGAAVARGETPMIRLHKASIPASKRSSRPFAALAAALAFMLVGIPHPTRTQAAGPSQVASTPLTEPMVLRSVNGVLQATLVLKSGPATVAGQPVNDVWTYRVGEDGAPNYPGPTLCVNRGDTIKLHYVNRLD